MKDDVRHAARAIVIYRNWLAIYGESWPNDLDFLRLVVRSAQDGETNNQECSTSPQTVADHTLDTDTTDGSQTLCTTSEAARRLSVSPSTVRRLRDRGELPDVRVGARGVRFRAEDIDTYISLNYR